MISKVFYLEETEILSHFSNFSRSILKKSLKKFFPRKRKDFFLLFITSDLGVSDLERSRANQFFFALRSRPRLSRDGDMGIFIIDLFKFKY